MGFCALPSLLISYLNSVPLVHKLIKIDPDNSFNLILNLGEEKSEDPDRPATFNEIKSIIWHFWGNLPIPDFFQSSGTATCLMETLLIKEGSKDMA
jgi:hypothetical protein